MGSLHAAFCQMAVRCRFSVPVRAARRWNWSRRPAVPFGTRTVFLLVPGLLGYGWEWDAAQAELAKIPFAVTLVWPWDPWKSLSQSGDALARHVGYLVRRVPDSVDRVVVVGHSAAGLLVLWAASRVLCLPALADDGVGWCAARRAGVLTVGHSGRAADAVADCARGDVFAVARASGRVNCGCL